MRYKSGAAFRRALEDRLRTMSLETGVPLVRLKVRIAVDQILPAHPPEDWGLFK